MKKRILLVAAIVAAVFGITLLAAGPSSAQSSSCTSYQGGQVNDCFGWTFDYGMDESASRGRGLTVEGVRLIDGSGDQKLMVSRAAFPGMPVRYDNDTCGPYVDQFSRLNYYGTQLDVYADVGSDPQTGRQWLELGASHQIGGYVIYTAYYFTDDGEMHMRIFARGMSCDPPTNHEHYPHLLVDVDTGPGSASTVGTDDELYYVANNTLIRQTTEANNEASQTGHQWVVRDPGGDSVLMEYDAGGFQASLANCGPGLVNEECTGTSSSYVPPSAFSNNFIQTRNANYSTDEQRWIGSCPAGFCTGFDNYNDGMWPYYDAGETITDPVIVVRGYLDHTEVGNNAVIRDDWHTTGIKLRLIDDPFSTSPTTTPAPPTSVPPTSVVPTSVPPTSIPPTSVIPTATPAPLDITQLPFTQSGLYQCTGNTSNAWVSWDSPVILTGGVAVDVSTAVAGTGEMEASGTSADQARLQYRTSDSSPWQTISSVDGNPVGSSSTLSGTSLANGSGIQFRVGSYVTYAANEQYCFSGLQVTASGQGPTATAVPTSTVVLPTPIPPTAVPSATPTLIPTVPPTTVPPTTVPTLPPTPVPGGCVLVDEVSQTKSAPAGGSVTCTIQVPANATSLDVDISDGSGEADVYVQFGSAPTTVQSGNTGPDDSEPDYCSVWANGNDENCSFTNPVAGTWYVTVADFFNGGFANVNLVADWESTGNATPSPTPVPSPTPTPVPTITPTPVPSATPVPTSVPPVAGACAEGSTWNLQTNTGGDTDRCTINLPSGVSTLTITMDGPAASISNEADLYVNWGSAPAVITTGNIVIAQDSTSCTYWTDGNTATCTFTNPQAGIWHVLVADYDNRGYSNITVTTDW